MNNLLPEIITPKNGKLYATVKLLGVAQIDAYSSLQQGHMLSWCVYKGGFEMISPTRPFIFNPARYYGFDIADVILFWVVRISVIIFASLVSASLITVLSFSYKTSSEYQSYLRSVSSSASRAFQKLALFCFLTGHIFHNDVIFLLYFNGEFVILVMS